MLKLDDELRDYQAKSQRHSSGSGRQAGHAQARPGPFPRAGDLGNSRKDRLSKNLRCFAFVPDRFVADLNEEGTANAAEQSYQQASNNHDGSLEAVGTFGWNRSVQNLKPFAGALHLLFARHLGGKFLFLQLIVVNAERIVVAREFSNLLLENGRLLQLADMILNLLLKLRLSLYPILDILVQFIYFCLDDGIALLRCWRARLRIRRIPHRFFALDFDLELVDFIAQLPDVQIIGTVANQHVLHLRFKLLEARLGG